MLNLNDLTTNHPTTPCEAVFTELLTRRQVIHKLTRDVM
jgi:hypothetical protein